MGRFRCLRHLELLVRAAEDAAAGRRRPLRRPRKWIAHFVAFLRLLRRCSGRIVPPSASALALVLECLFPRASANPFFLSAMPRPRGASSSVRSCASSSPAWSSAPGASVAPQGHEGSGLSGACQTLLAKRRLGLLGLFHLPPQPRPRVGADLTHTPTTMTVEWELPFVASASGRRGANAPGLVLWAIFPVSAAMAVELVR